MVVSWTAIPGAESYTVVIEETDAFCPAGTVVTNHTYVVTGTSFTYPGTTTCGWAIKFQSNISVTIAGVTSAPSPWMQR